MTGTRSPMERLAAALNEVKRQCSDLAVVGNLWMHIKHPIHPVQEALLKQMDAAADNHGESHASLSRKGSGFGVVLIGRFAWCLLYAAYLSARLLRLRLRLRRELGSLRRQSFDLIAKTWRFEDGLLAATRDFYYGDLQQQLSDRGVRALILTGNPTEAWRAMPTANASAVTPQQLPELCLVPLFAPMRMAWQQLRTAFRLRRIAQRASDPLVRHVALRACRDALSTAITPIGAYYWIGRSIAKIWYPRAFMTLYEGYAWEQCLWRGIKSVAPSCKTVGYQHTVLFRHNLALLQPQEDERACVRPDVVMCLGPRTQSMLRSSHRRSELFSFGTFRNVPQPRPLRTPRPDRRTVLVLPEGLLQETTLLFDRATQVARLLPQDQFIFRCHPALPFEKVRSLLEGDPTVLANVHVSVHPNIEQDFDRSSVILYRGSSSVLYAVLYGLKPIYLREDRRQEVDPLFELREWRERASSVQEMKDILQCYGQADADEAAASWRQAVEYVTSYTMAADETSVDQLLFAVGINGLARMPG